MSGRDASTAARPIPRPPIRQATMVGAPAEHTFDVFVRRIGEWWPRPYSVGGDRVGSITLEPRLGGRLYETWDDGTVAEWGEVTSWEPPAGFVLSWRCTPAPTVVELRFRSLGPHLTRVELEHRGWESLSEAQLGEDCAEPGGYLGGAYSSGWRNVLDALAAAAHGPGRRLR